MHNICQIADVEVSSLVVIVLKSVKWSSYSAHSESPIHSCVLQVSSLHQCSWHFPSFPCAINFPMMTQILNNSMSLNSVTCFWYKSNKSSTLAFKSSLANSNFCSLYCTAVTSVPSSSSAIFNYVFKTFFYNTPYAGIQYCPWTCSFNGNLSPGEDNHHSLHVRKGLEEKYHSQHGVVEGLEKEKIADDENNVKHASCTFGEITAALRVPL